MNQTSEISFKDLVAIIRRWILFFLSKWILISLVTLIFGIAGILYAWYQKPVYIAEISFAPENDKGSGMGAYVGLASQFGLDLGSANGGIFDGENLGQLLKSKMLIQRTLLSPVLIENKQDLLINYYLKSIDLRKALDENPKLRSVSFTADMQPGIRVRDSVMKKVVEDVGNALLIDKPDKKLNLIVARMEDRDELFAKTFVEQLVLNGIRYYVDYRSKKSRENVGILQRQTDSVEHLLTGNIVSVAASSDLNVNPIRQIGRANVQRKQVDVQVTSQVYGELLKQLELSKISLRKETPLIQVIDVPILPLEKKKLGRLKGGLLFGFVGLFLCLAYLIIRKILLSS